MLTVRPRVRDLVFQVYGRSIHPELFEIVKSKSIDRGPYQADILITSSGHLVTWRHRGATLSEVATSAQNPLVQKRRLLSYKLRGNRTDEVNCKGGIRYQTSFQLEEVEPEIFWSFQQELMRDGERRGILHTFNPSSRIALGALSFIDVETRARSMLVQAFHTFPDDFAIVKSQSLYELP